MAITMQVDVERMRVLSAPCGNTLARIVRAVEDDVITMMTLQVSIGHTFAEIEPLTGTLDFMAYEHVPLGTSTRCILRGEAQDAKRTKLEVCLHFNAAEMYQGTVRVLS